MDKTITVMVVEDILSARETVINLLRALGFSSFLEAENGEEALEKLKASLPGLIISDWNMPKMNGLGLLRAVRSRQNLPYIPFIFLTSKSEVEDVALASDTGASAYLVKPVTIKALSEALNTVFEGSFEQEFELLKVEIQTLCADKEHGKAYDLLRRFELLYPSHAQKIRLEHVRILTRLSDYSAAEEILCHILSANPLFVKGWETMAKIQSWQGKWDQALAAADKAVSISPNNTEYYILRGSINLHKENLHEARKNFMMALNTDRKNDQIKQDIWNAYVDLDMVDEVQRDFGSYIFSFLTCDTLNNMAVAYRRKGELARAVEIYRAALAKEPDNPKILFNAAVAYVNRKQYGKAKTLLAHALGNDPGFEKAKALLAQIHGITEHKTGEAEKSGDAA
jgi:CheY-like chemotaxis protein